MPASQHHFPGEYVEFSGSHLPPIAQWVDLQVFYFLINSVYFQGGMGEGRKLPL